MNSLDYPSAPRGTAALARNGQPRTPPVLAFGRALRPLLYAALGASLVVPAIARALAPSPPRTPAAPAAPTTPAARARLAPAPLAPVPPHDIHLTYSRVVVDGASVIFRVRLFHDDLEKALQVHAHNPALKVAPGMAAADTAFASYFDAHVPVTANGRRLAPRVIQSGKDMDVTDQEMWWYLVELTAPSPVTSLSMRVGLLFEHFTDQRNIVTLLKMPGEKRYSMYFVREDAKPQEVVF